MKSVYCNKLKSSGLIVSKLITEYILLLFLNINRFFFKFSYNNSTIQSIIIPLFHGIGDAIIFTVCIRQLKNIYPNASITLLTTNRTKDVLYDTFPTLNYLCFSGLKNVLNEYHDYDLMILPSRHLKHYLLALILKPKKLIGYNYTLSIKKEESHIDRANRIAASLGSNSRLDPFISVSEKIQNFIKDKFLSNLQNDSSVHVVSFLIGGRWKTKTYSNDYYQIIIEVLLKLPNTIILLLGNTEIFFKNLNYPVDRVKNFCGKTSIQEVMGLISISDLVVGPDGGLLNIAMALNKKIVGIFGPVNPDTIVSNKYQNQIIFKKQCPYQPCYNEDHEPYCPFERPLCMDINPQVILEKINIFL